MTPTRLQTTGNSKTWVWSAVLFSQPLVIPQRRSVLPYRAAAAALILSYSTSLWTLLSCGAAAVVAVWSTSGGPQGRRTMQFWGENPGSYQRDLQDCWYHRFHKTRRSFCFPNRTTAAPSVGVPRVSGEVWRLIKEVQWFTVSKSDFFCCCLPVDAGLVISASLSSEVDGWKLRWDHLLSDRQLQLKSIVMLCVECREIKGCRQLTQISNLPVPENILTRPRLSVVNSPSYITDKPPRTNECLQRQSLRWRALLSQHRSINSVQRGKFCFTWLNDKKSIFKNSRREQF